MFKMKWPKYEKKIEIGGEAREVRGLSGWRVPPPIVKVWLRHW